MKVIVIRSNINLGPHLVLLIYEQDQFNHFYTFLNTSITTELTFQGPISTSGLIQLPFFLVLIFSWECDFDCFLTLQVFLARAIWNNFILGPYLRKLIVKIVNIFFICIKKLFFIYHDPFMFKAKSLWEFFLFDNFGEKPAIFLRVYYFTSIF